VTDATWDREKAGYEIIRRPVPRDSGKAPQHTIATSPTGSEAG
jgi:hypothetical protein